MRLCPSSPSASPTECGAAMEAIAALRAARGLSGEWWRCAAAYPNRRGGASGSGVVARHHGEPSAVGAVGDWDGEGEVVAGGALDGSRADADPRVRRIASDVDADLERS